MANPLSYDSFHDPHLQSYFENKNVKKHLRKVGLINRHGEKLSQKEYQATINQRSRQGQIRALLSHGIVQRVVQLEKSREANIRNQFEFEAKKLLVENVKESRHQYKELRSKDFILFNRPKTTNINNNQIHQQQIKIIDEYKISPTRSPSKKIRHKSPKINKTKDHCEITMIYLGGQTKGEGVEIVIMQQHCGGQNLIVFKDLVKPNEKFRFESRRHSEYPFALSLYVNGLIDCRISVCCEYKHKLGLPLGGKRGSFAILNVQGGKPCQTCRFNEYMYNNRRKSSDQNSINTNTTYEQSEAHRLLRTPSPYDKHENETIVSNQNDEYNEAEEMYKNILNKFNKNISWKENGYLHCQLGNICKEGLGDYSKALEHYLLSLEILCEKMSSLDLKLRNIYLSIAHILLLQGQIKNKLTIEYFERILLIDNSLNNLNEYNLINDHNYLGLLYKNEENYSKALFHFNKSLQYFLLINSKNNFNEHFYSNDYSINETIYDLKAFKSLSIDKLPNLCDIHFNLATIYQNLGQKQNALKHAQKAHQLSSNQDQNKFEIYQNYFKRLQQI